VDGIKPVLAENRRSGRSKPLIQQDAHQATRSMSSRSSSTVAAA